MKTHTPLPRSWEAITTQIKEHFGIESFTKEQASETMKMYITGMSVEDMIKHQTKTLSCWENQ